MQPSSHVLVAKASLESGSLAVSRTGCDERLGFGLKLKPWVRYASLRRSERNGPRRHRRGPGRQQPSPSDSGIGTRVLQDLGRL